MQTHDCIYKVLLMLQPEVSPPYSLLSVPLHRCLLSMPLLLSLLLHYSSSHLSSYWASSAPCCSHVRSFCWKTRWIVDWQRETWGPNSGETYAGSGVKASHGSLWATVDSGFSRWLLLSRHFLLCSCLPSWMTWSYGGGKSHCWLRLVRDCLWKRWFHQLQQH